MCFPLWFIFPEEVLRSVLAGIGCAKNVGWLSSQRKKKWPDWVDILFLTQNPSCRYVRLVMSKLHSNPEEIKRLHPRSFLLPSFCPFCCWRCIHPSVVLVEYCLCTACAICCSLKSVPNKFKFLFLASMFCIIEKEGEIFCNL